MSSKPSCYCYWGGQISTDCGHTVSCGTSEPGYFNSSSRTQLCCVEGDTCGANSICKASAGGSHPALGSGFYLGGCTDPTFEDPLCRKDCNEGHTPLYGNDVVYENDTDTWSCCGRTSDGTDQVNCSNPLTDLSFAVDWKPADFPGPIDETLTPAVTTIPSSHASISTATEPAQATGSASEMPSSSSGHSDELSSGAKIGIGVGVVLVVLAVVGLIWFLMIRKRSKTRLTSHATGGWSPDNPGAYSRDDGRMYEKGAMQSMTAWRSSDGEQSGVGELDSRAIYESPQHINELDAQRMRHELQ